MNIANKIVEQIKYYKFMLLGVLAAVLLYVSAAGMLSVVAPWDLKGDTQFHIDYIWRLDNGELPKFKEGIQYPPFEKDYSGPVHLVASHPPLFYLIHVLFIGGMLEEGNWEQAIAAGRLINIALGVLVILSLAWAGWVFGGRRKELFAVAGPAIGALTYRFVSLNLNYTVDVLLILFATLAFINIYKIFKFGLEPKYIISLTILSILGMSTKAPYIVILAVSILSIFVALLIKYGINKKSTIKGLGISALVLIPTILSIGWFYYLNYKQSGSWFKSTTEGFTGGRPYKSLIDVLTGSKLWSLFYQHSSNSPFLATAITSLSAGGIINMKKSAFVKLKNNKSLVAIIGIMSLATLGILYTQLVLAVGYGSINFRYMLAVLLPFSLLISLGLLEYKRLRGQLISIYAILMSAGVVFYAASSKTMNKLVPETIGSNKIDSIYVATSSNGLPNLVPTLLLMFFFIGSILLILSMFRLSKNN